jgi:hypothetical protein
MRCSIGSDFAIIRCRSRPFAYQRTITDRTLRLISLRRVFRVRWRWLEFPRAERLRRGHANAAQRRCRQSQTGSDRQQQAVAIRGRSTLPARSPTTNRWAKLSTFDANSDRSATQGRLPTKVPAEDAANHVASAPFFGRTRTGSEARDWA